MNILKKITSCQHGGMFLFFSSVGYCASKSSASKLDAWTQQNDVCHMEHVQRNNMQYGKFTEQTRIAFAVHLNSWSANAAHYNVGKSLDHICSISLEFFFMLPLICSSERQNHDRIGCLYEVRKKITPTTILAAFNTLMQCQKCPMSFSCFIFNNLPLQSLHCRLIQACSMHTDKVHSAC